MNMDLASPFSTIVLQFITKYCDIAPDLSIADATLFHRFRAFWLHSTYDLPDTALLGQFRVTMTQLGFRSSDGKKPRWYGLALRKPLHDAQIDQSASESLP